MYWLSIALIRVGRTNLAIKALANARQLVPHGKSSVMYKRLTNDYGMPKSTCCEHDDYQAFFSIQVRRYLTTVRGAKFSSQFEMDTVLELIASNWMQFKKAHNLQAIPCGEKVRLFEGYRIHFPQLRVSELARCKVMAFSAYRNSHEFSLHNRVCMPWETKTV